MTMSVRGLVAPDAEISTPVPTENRFGNVRWSTRG